jgi:CRISPR-associated endonuclease/helicase Cas3
MAEQAGANSIRKRQATGEPFYAAHTPNTAGEWHGLEDHLTRVAEKAAEFGARFGAGELAHRAGLLHDIGKYSDEFQDYLDKCHRASLGLEPKPRPGAAPHKAAGAVAVRELGGDLLAPVILGHHGGMESPATANAALQRETSDSVQQLLKVAASDCHEVAHQPDLKPRLRQLCPTPLEGELLARMLFSCLVDADALDTERHFDASAAALRTGGDPPFAVLRERLRCSQEALTTEAENEPSDLNALRREVYEACLAAAPLPPGLFKLTVPTGGGKTRSSLAFALEHALAHRQHRFERVIYAIPYTSIADQTAQVFEDILGSEAILEHHSALEPDQGKPEQEMWRRLASQNWDAPLIVTTTVQLFESLFGNRPARCRKVHRLARSVIVLDEVQTLPVQRLRPIADALRALCEQYGATVVLCTATQPALDEEALDAIGFPEAREIVPDPRSLFGRLKRVEYDLRPLSDPSGWEWERVAEEMRRSTTCLTIVNTRKQATALLQELEQSGEALHLSTLLCGRHRRETLAEIRRRLKVQERCHVVSTQVVEAGVDLDFPRVMRAIGPLDRIVQAAGRCNREGRLPTRGKVTVFRPADDAAPRGSYHVASEVAARFLREGADLHDPDTYDRYFRAVYRQDTLDALGIQKLRAELDFPGVADSMRLIEETASVLVRHEPAREEIESLLARARSRRKMSGTLWREMQPFLVSLPQRDMDRFRNQDLVREDDAVPDLLLWQGGYDPVAGLSAAAIEPSELIC